MGDWGVFSRLVQSRNGFELMRLCRSAGGYGTVAVAIREQLNLWSKSLSDEEDLRRRCLVAEFLNKAGQSCHAIALLRAPHDQRLVRPATRAVSLGLLADAILCDEVFSSSSGTHQDPHRLLVQAVDLLRGLDREELDEVALAQNLSNLCFTYGRKGNLPLAEAAGREAVEIFGRLRHCRLAQAEQHLGHVFSKRGGLKQAFEMYKKSIATFERTGAAVYDTEYACSLHALGTVLHYQGGHKSSVAETFEIAAVLRCEAITGRDHPEAQYYRASLGARAAEDLTLSPADEDAMRTVTWD